MAIADLKRRGRRGRGEGQECLFCGQWLPAVAACLLCLAGANSALADEPKVELLWPKGAPESKGDTPNDKPTLTVLPAPAEKANGAAVVICPGGGYGAVMMTYEGVDVGRWFNTLGVSAFVLNYRHAGRGYQHPAPLEDAQRAIRTVRARAAEWKLDPKRIGILGFSAGGHLASTAGTHFDDGRLSADDPIERVGCRPDFLILIYPVITFSPPYTHGGSVRNLLGEKPDPKLIESLSNEKQVTANTPPTFLVASTADTVVPAENSIQFFLALRQAKVPAELHVYERGNHGFGMAQNDPAVGTWTKLCAEWLKLHGFVK
jgi:acetyl esterase/lipase